jgi:hypothetical protein
MSDYRWSARSFLYQFLMRETGQKGAEDGEGKEAYT